MSDQPTCRICQADDPGRLACMKCEARMRRQLTEILEFYALTEAELLPGRSGGSGASTERSIGVRIVALDFLAGHDVVDVLGQWEVEWRELFGARGAHPRFGRVKGTLTEIVGFLSRWLHVACGELEVIADFAQEVNEAWTQARNAARMAPAKSTTIPCPSVLEVEVPQIDEGIVVGVQVVDVSCDARLKVSIDRLGDDVTCRNCGETYSLLDLMHYAIEDGVTELWVDPEAAAAWFKKPERTLRSWANAGRIRRENSRYELHSIHVVIHPPIEGEPA